MNEPDSPAGEPPEAATPGGPHGTRQRIRHTSQAVTHRVSDSEFGHVWQRLSALDFINEAILLAGVLLLCFFPFLIVYGALLGRPAVSGLAQRLGLNNEAAHDLGTLFTSTDATSSAVTVTSCVFLLLYGLCAASAIADLYEKTFALESRGLRDLPRRFFWLWFLVGAVAFTSWLGPTIKDAGGPFLLAVVSAVLFTFFWWFTMWFLLAGRLRWRELLPAAVATGIFWLGMEAVFNAVFSGIVINNNDLYGPIGIVFALLSWLIAIGVVIILGAVVGMVWNDRRRRTEVTMDEEAATLEAALAEERGSEAPPAGPSSASP
jgi:membrane protein